MILCIIPARGGSKRIPHKNTILLAGKPLLAHSIEHAKNAQLVSRVIVSTDDEAISQIAQSYCAEVVKRPEELATDQASSESALLHTLDEVEKESCHPKLIVFLQCTSPIRSPKDIDQAIQKLKAERADSLFSVCRNDRFLWRKNAGQIQSLNYDYRKRHRDQEHPEEYRENGSIYVFKPELLRKDKNRLGGKIAVYEMDYWSSFQVDSPEHLELCDWILTRKKKANPFNPNFKKPKLIVSDFDGVFTNNKVLVSQDGVESVLCDRSDSWGLSAFRKLDIPFVVLSTESNEVVGTRCKKLQIPCYQNSKNKLDTLKKIASDLQLNLKEILYIGNDTNDLECFRQVGFGVAVADAHPEILAQAKLVLSCKGGEGAIRELCDSLISSYGSKSS